MQASFYEGNKTFSVKEVEAQAPLKGEVKIKVAYAGICGTDVHIYHGVMDQRVSIPQTVGHEMSGIVEELGEGVEGYAVGDRVVVRPLDNRAEKASDKGFSHICSGLKFMGIDSTGTFANYWTVPAFTLHKLPQDIDLKLAALIEPVSVACHDVRMGELKAGETAVIIGGGPIGMLIGMVAREKGANVILSEVNETRLALAKELGFKTVNPIKEDAEAFVSEATAGALADVVFEVSGSGPGVDIMTDLAGIRGRIVMVAIHAQPKPTNLFKFFWKELKMVGARVYESEDYEESIRFISEGKIDFTPIITDVQPLSKIQAAFEGIDTNPNSMKVLIDCTEN